MIYVGETGKKSRRSGSAVGINNRAQKTDIRMENRCKSRLWGIGALLKGVPCKVKMLAFEREAAG